jgi:LPXTG-motif cell wall-anchored protein
MKHLSLLAAIYALVAALVLPSSLLASDDAGPAAGEPPSAETAPAEEPPTAPPEPAQPAPEAAQPAPAPEQAPPAPEQPAAAPDQAAPAPTPPAEPVPGDAPERPRVKAVAAASGSVTIVDFEFTPAQITIDQGDTVTWTNNGPTPHSATAPDGSFDTGIFPAGQSRSHTFNDAGTFSYICSPHPNMEGTVVVRASQSGGDTPDSSTGDTGDTGGSADTGSDAGEAAQSDDGPSLPNTGTDAGALLVLGALMLLLGVAVHRRARAEQPRPAGRIGW